MSLMRKSLYAFVFIGLMTAGVSAQSVKDTIEAANAAFATAYNGKDAAGVAALYDQDAAILPSGSTRIDGRENIQKYWQGGMDGGFNSLSLNTKEVQDAGDWAYEVGTYTAKYPDKSGKMMDDVGKYVVVWKKSANGKWLLYRDIWNSDPPKTQ